MHDNSFIFSIFLIFTGAALLATLALYTRQSLLVAYMFLGLLLGPNCLKLVPHLALARNIGGIGIIFLLFLLGLDLTPQELFNTLRKTTIVTLVSSVLFATIGFVEGHLLGFTFIESVLIGITLIFSSTIIGLKLLPATALHHKPVGDAMVSILLMQDLIAIVTLLLVQSVEVHVSHSKLVDISIALLTLPLLLGFAFLVQHYIIAKLFVRFDRIKEYIFLVALGWCLGLAQLAASLGLSAGIGAFIAGISIAEGPIASYIAESLKPLRDFCLVMFFFGIGASFNLQYLPQVFVPAIILAGLVLLLKPWLFKILLYWSGEKSRVASEVGLRLGQTSEFSLLLAYLAAEVTPPLISAKVNYLLQATTLITFIISSYWVAYRYPTPLAFTDRMRRE